MPGRSLLMKASGARLLYPGYVQNYLDRVTAADVAAGNTLGLELGVTDAFNTCLQALVADGILGVSGGVLSQAASLIKASCFMMGPRTLPGALVPLAADMPAPTNFNFTGLRYNRRTGLQGDGASMYLNSNRADNASTPDDRHVAVYISTLGTLTNVIILGANPSSPTGCTYIQQGAEPTTRVRIASATSTLVASAQYGGFCGASRSLSASCVVRTNNANTTVTQASSAPVTNLPIFIFAQNLIGGPNSYTNARINFYSIGSALDLAILDARITALSNAIQAAIAP